MASSIKDIVVVEIHSYAGDVEKPTVLRGDFIISAQWSSSVSPQHGSAKVAIKSSVFDIPTYLFPEPGDWIILRDESGRAVFFGRVVTVDDSISMSGSTAVSSLTFTAVSWLDSLDLSEAFAPDGALDQTIGTLFTKQDWASTTLSFFQSYVFGQVGEALQILWRNLARVRLPKSLTGKYLGDLIPVVYDNDTRNAWAPDMVVESLPVAGALPTQLSFLAVKSRVYDLLRGLFVPEPGLIELFPHLAPAIPDFTQEQYSARPAMTVPVTPEFLDATEQGKSNKRPSSIFYPKPEDVWSDMFELERILGVRPVIIYRVRPWRSRPLSESVYAEPEADNAPEKELESSKSQAKLLLKDTFNMVTWDKKYFTKIPYDFVTSISRSRSLSEQATCTTINLVLSQLEALAAAGLPVKNKREILNKGLRTIQTTWPFIIRPKEDAKLSSFIAYMRTIAAQVMSFYAKGHQLGSGSVECTFSSKDGVGSRFFLVNAVGGKPFSVYYNKDGSDFYGLAETTNGELDGPDAVEFSAYCEAVSRSISVIGSSVVSRTSISFSRGLYGHEESRFRESIISIPDAPSATSNQTPTSGGSPPGGRAAGPAADPIDGCSRGLPAKVWPGQLQLASIDFPSWLQSWVLSRIVSSVELTKIGLIWNTIPSEYNDVVSVKVGKTPTGEDILENTTKYTLYHNVVILSACAYVIAKYWKQKDPGSDINIHSWAYARDGSTHPFAAAIDFTIKLSDGSKVPALQAWYALSVLGRAKRIPLGGRGLYLNVNPSTGIQGTDASAAGSASSVISGPGGSSATHYDSRGAFDIKGIKKTSAPAIWAGLDWTGDGKDELTTSESVSVDDVFALVADPDGVLLKKHGSSTLVKNMFNKEDKKNPVGIRANWKGDKTELALRNDPEGLAYVKSRKELKDALKNYYYNKATINIGNVPDAPVDSYLPAVTNAVPNVLQVLGIEDWCKANDYSPAAQTEALSQQIFYDPNIGVFVPAASPNAPLIFAFSGDSVASARIQNIQLLLDTPGAISKKQRDILEATIAKSNEVDPAGRVMLYALSALISKCHLFVSSNKNVDGSKVYPFVKSSCDSNGISITALDHTFFAFSSGWKTAKQAYTSDLSKSCKYAYIVDFEGKQQAAVFFALSLSRSFKTASQVYYTNTNYGFGGAGGIFLAGMSTEFRDSNLVYEVKPPAPDLTSGTEPLTDLDLHINCLKTAAGYLKNRIEGYTPGPSKKLTITSEYGELWTAAPTSPLILVYGGTAVKGRKSGEYMLDYFRSLTVKNNVFIATDNQVDGADSFSWAKGAATPAGTSPAWRKKILFVFSGGQLPAKDILAQPSDLDQFDKIYLADPYLGTGSTHEHWWQLANSNPAKFVFVYTDVPLGETLNKENGMTKIKLGIFKDAIEGGGVIRLVDAVPTSLETTPSGPVWVPERKATKSELLDAHMKTNAVSVGFMLSIDDADK
jgi:hypothetical protein